MGRRLVDKTALVTGAGRGIGKAVALAFAREGAALVICSRTAAELKETAREAAAAGAPVVAPACDVTVAADVDRLVKEALAAYGRIDVLVNNAGILGPHKPLADVEEAEWDRTLRANATSAFLVTRAVLRASMLARGSGCVINVSSSQGRRGTAGWGPYAASKFALEGMTQVWADEHKDRIRFYTLNPSATKTAMRALAYPSEDPAALKEPEAVGEAFVALAAGGGAAPTGAAVYLDRATGRLHS